EEMREPGAAAALVARTHVVVDDDRKERGRVILGDDHAQAVLEPRITELNLADRRGGEGEHRHQAEDRRPAEASDHGFLSFSTRPGGSAPPDPPTPSLARTLRPLRCGIAPTARFRYQGARIAEPESRG